MAGLSGWDPSGPGSPPQQGGAGGGGQTAGGLARRVRGANLPPSTPMSLHRTHEPQQVDPARPADDVYDFLSNFQAGVRRGRDDAHGDGPNDPGRPS
jgi:hypothetical protein